MAAITKTTGSIGNQGKTKTRFGRRIDDELTQYLNVIIFNKKVT